MKSSIYKEEAGFTLLEILWVVVILGILTAIATPFYLNSKKTQYDFAVVTEAKALEMKVSEYKGFHAYKAPATIQEAEYSVTANNVNLSYKASGMDFCIFASHEGSGKYSVETPYTVYNGTEASCPL